MCPFLIYPLIYFVVDELEASEDNSYYEDHNMNIANGVAGSKALNKEDNTGDPIDNGRRIQSIEMTEKEERETAEAKPATNSRRNLLSDSTYNCVVC